MTGLQFSLRCAGLFLLTASILALQLLEMRLLSYMLWHHLAYVVISVVLLGLGAGGAIVAVLPRWMLPRSATLIALSASLTGLATIGAFAVLTRVELDTFSLSHSRLFSLVLYYAALVVPYLFAGMALALIFTVGIGRIGTLYGVDLAGSAVGCYLFYLLIEPLGAPSALVAMSLVSVVAGVFFALADQAWRTALTAILAAAGLISAYPYADTILAPRPAPSKSLARNLNARGARLASTRWTPISRVDVLEADESTNDFVGEYLAGDQMKMITADGDANTWLMRNPDVRQPLPPLGAEFLRDYHIAFLLKDSPETLILGPGGGNEVFVAHTMGARRIVAVELNAAILDVSLRMYPQFAGHIYGSPIAQAHVGEGRSFVRHRDDRFDIIQMSGVDTWAGLSSGAYVLAENFLYTVEAVKDFYGRLKPEGLLSIGRFRMEPPRESLRLVAVALQALRELGVCDPERRIAILSFRSSGLARLLIKRGPFTPSEVITLDREVAGSGGELYYAPGRWRDNPYCQLLRAFLSNTEWYFFEQYPYDVTPVYDDRPFFFEYYKWSRIWHDVTRPGAGGQVGANRPVGLMVLGGLLLQLTALVLALIIAPLAVFRRQGLTVPCRGSIVLYFACLGFGYMFVEIGLMQRFVLFLSHPAYSIPVVLATLLVSSGLGSFAASRLRIGQRARLRFALVGVVVAAVVLLLSLGWVFDMCLGLAFAARVALSIALLLPLGLFMGMPFPLGLAAVSRIGVAVIPWVWGINGGASVLGSVVAIVLAMSGGFSWVLAASAGFYGLALWCVPRLVRTDAGE
jgi:hypothetical protein